MKRFKIALKESLKVVLLSLFFLIVGLAFILPTKDNFNVLSFIGWFFCLMAAIGLTVGVVSQFKDTLNSTCSSCYEWFSKAENEISYSFKCSSYIQKMSSNGNYTGTQYEMTCRIDCPFCGNANIFTYKYTTPKGEGDAEVATNKYVKSLLKAKPMGFFKKKK